MKQGGADAVEKERTRGDTDRERSEPDKEEKKAERSRRNRRGRIAMRLEGNRARLAPRQVQRARMQRAMEDANSHYYTRIADLQPDFDMSREREREERREGSTFFYEIQVLLPLQRTFL